MHSCEVCECLTSWYITENEEKETVAYCSSHDPREIKDVDKKPLRIIIN